MIRPARILVMRGGAIGDFIVTLPALAALRARWPDSYIELIGYPHVARLALESGWIDRIRPVNDIRLARYFAPDAPIREEDQSYFAAFDFVVQYMHDPQGALKANLKRCGVKVMIEASPLVNAVHATDHFLKPLESLAIYGADATPRLLLKDHIPHSMTLKRLVIHPGSGSRSKNWPLEQFVEIANRAGSLRKINVTFVTGDSEREYIPGIEHALSRFERIHNEDLVTLAYRLRGAAAFLGNDSGISHMAAATGVPVLAIFGPTNPALWAPRGIRARIIHAPEGNLANLTADQVWESLVKLVDAPS